MFQSLNQAFLACLRLFLQFRLGYARLTLRSVTAGTADGGPASAAGPTLLEPGPLVHGDTWRNGCGAQPGTLKLPPRIRGRVGLVFFSAQHSQRAGCSTVAPFIMFNYILIIRFQLALVLIAQSKETSIASKPTTLRLCKNSSIVCLSIINIFIQF